MGLRGPIAIRVGSYRGAPVGAPNTGI
jgi:hypothetical protein